LKRFSPRVKNVKQKQQGQKKENGRLKILGKMIGG
jgi:hypothetical protein